MKLLYDVFIFLYPLGVRFLSFFNSKAADWIDGRKGVFESLQSFVDGEERRIIWMHCSSLGEFEQGLPVLEKLKATYPDYRLVVSFFSPSGYRVRKSHPLPDYVTYLPMDSKKNAERFLKILDPALVIFIKYEYWNYYLERLAKTGVPTLMVSAIFRPDQIFFKPKGYFYRRMLECFSHFFVQDQRSKDLLHSIDMKICCTVSGDTRFDRVIDIYNNRKAFPIIEQFKGACEVIVAGSTWKEDDNHLHRLIKHLPPSVKLIIAPHNITGGDIDRCLKLYPDPVLYSENELAFNNNLPLKEGRTLIIDNMGMLSSIYYYADVAYIGGGFGRGGIHNTLEAAIYGVPVIFGPVYDKYKEAIELIENAGAFSVHDLASLEAMMQLLLTNKTFLQKVGDKARDYVQDRAGASNKVLDFVQAKRLLMI